MSESISIHNFAGIKQFDIELKKINIFIGPQTIGKSITAKLIYFFKNVIDTMYRFDPENGLTKRDLEKRLKDTFTTYFPVESWDKSTFKIEYSIDDFKIEIECKDTKKIKISWKYRI